MCAQREALWLVVLLSLEKMENKTLWEKNENVFFFFVPGKKKVIYCNRY